MSSFKDGFRPLQALVFLALALLCIAAVFTAISLETSKKIGRLSSISNYDDVVYLDEVSQIYRVGIEQGTGSAVHALFTRNLHAPFPVFAGMAGFLAFGPHIDRAYYALAIVVFTFLAFVAALGRSLPIVLRAAFILGALALPFATMCAQQFRPDMMWAVVLGGTCVLFLSSGNPFGRRRHAVAAGAALALLLLTKPSIFAMTLLVAGGTWFLAAVIARISLGIAIRELAIHLAITIATAAALAGWYWVRHVHEIFDYFFVNSFGDNKEIWAFRGSLWSQLTYYIAPGKPLASNLGNFFYPLLFVFLIGAVGDLVRGKDIAARLRGGAFLWMLAGTCAVNAAFGMKSPFLGGSFYGFLIFGAIWYAARLLQPACANGWLRPVWRQVVFSGLILACCATAFSFPPACVVSPKLRRIQNSTNNGMLQDLLRTSNPEAATTIVVTQANPIVPQYFEIEFRVRHRKLTMISAATAHRSEEVLRYTSTADYVVLQDPGMSGSPEQNAIPAEKLQPELLAIFRADHAWRLIGTYPDGAGKSAYLYQHIR